MSSSNSAAGCLGYLIIGAIIFCIYGISQCTSNSQGGIMKEARSSNREYNYEKYLDKWPNGKFVEEASDSIVSICSRKSIYAIEDITKLRDKYKNLELSSRLDQVANRIVDIKYKEALETATIGGWEYYKKIVPDEYWRDADSHIQNINNKKWGTESRAWATAREMNTIDGYYMYAEKYPNGAHYKAADKKIIDLTVNSVFAGSHGELPSMDKSYWSNSSTSTISISNDTQYTLTLLYSGPDSRRLIIDSRKTRSITLPNGTYRIAASVSASNVRSFAGTENLTGGGYDVSYYISTTRY